MATVAHPSPPMLRGIEDRRDSALDLSPGFSIEEDTRLAMLLDKAFGRMSTFNGLYGVYEALQDGRSLAEALIGAVDSPMHPDQLVHAPAVLDKIEGFATLPRGIALEDGCGLGLFVDGLSRRFERLIVVDLSLCYLLLAAKIVEERGLDNVTLICASVERLPLADECIDFVHSNNVIEHVGDQAALVREAHRVLKADGLLFLLSPNRFSLYFEPHFRLPAFGFIPRPLRKAIVRWHSGYNVDDVPLLSLGELRGLLAPWFESSIAFVPRHLARVATAGRGRKAIVALLASPGGGAVSWLLNRALLAVMPYHAAVCVKL